MNDLLSITRNVAEAIGLLIVVVYVLYRVARWARKRAKGAYVLGAALAPFIAPGNVTDPDGRIVHEAKQHKKREDGEPGDPPSHDDDNDADFGGH